MADDGPRAGAVVSDRQRTIHDITAEVADEMGHYAYWCSYDGCWKPRRGPRLDGIVAAVMRAMERRDA